MRCWQLDAATTIRIGLGYVIRLVHSFSTSDPSLEFHWHAVMNIGECALRVIWESDQRYPDIPVKSRNESERGILHEQKQRTLRRNRGWWQETRCGTRRNADICPHLSLSVTVNSCFRLPHTGTTYTITYLNFTPATFLLLHFISISQLTSVQPSATGLPRTSHRHRRFRVAQIVPLASIADCTLENIPGFAF